MCIIPTVNPPLISATKSFFMLYFGNHLIIGNKPMKNCLTLSREQEHDVSFVLIAWTRLRLPVGDSLVVLWAVPRRGALSSYTLRAILISAISCSTVAISVRCWSAVKSISFEKPPLYPADGSVVSPKLRHVDDLRCNLICDSHSCTCHDFPMCAAQKQKKRKHVIFSFFSP